MFKYLLSILLGILFVFSSFSQEIVVKAKLDTNAILIGDQFHLIMEMTKPASNDMFFPLLQDTIIKEIEIVDVAQVDTINASADMLTLQKVYTLTSFDSGAYIIEPFAFVVDSIDTIYNAKSLFVVVNTFAVDTTKQQIADIKAPFEAPMTFREFIQEYWVYIAIVLFAILAIVLFILYGHKLIPSKKEKPKPKKPTIPGYIIALKELDELKEKKLWQNNDVKGYYIELTDILRTYLFNQFDVYSLEMTTAETIDEVSRLDIITDDFKSRILQVLSTADFVKFAKAQPLPDEHDLSYKNAYYFVEETKILILNKENKDKKEPSVNTENKPLT